MSRLNLHCVKTNLNLGTQTELVTLGTDATVHLHMYIVQCTVPVYLAQGRNSYFWDSVYRRDINSSQIY